MVAAAPSRAAVTIEGVEDSVRENVDAYLVEPPACNAAAEDVELYTASLPERLRPALEAYGYYDAAIEARLEARADDCWQVRVSIDPGMAIVVDETNVELTGAAEDDALFAELFAQFPLVPGEALRHGEYRMFKDRVEVLARQRGYLDAMFTSERVAVFTDQGTAAIELTWDSGPRYAFGSIAFDTNVLAEELLDAFVPFETGDPFDASLVTELQRQLTASGYFASADVRANVGAAEDYRIPIVVNVSAGSATSYSVGGGYSTDDGPRFRFSYSDERANRAGHQYQIEALLSTVRQRATFEYRVPAGNPQRDWWSYRAGAEREDIDAGVGVGGRAGLRRTHVLDAATMAGYIDGLYEQYEVGGAEHTTRMLLPGASWVRTYRDDLLRPREGHRISLAGSTGFASDVSLLQIDVSGKWVMATPWQARVLIRGRAATIVEDGDFDAVPLSLRYFAGGDNSVRGYDYESLGPRNVDGELIGGNRLIEASVEYEHPILDDWAAAVFVDSGAAWLHSDPDFSTGVGIGARWFSPIGPIRLDLAWPLDRDKTTPELHISIGPDL